MKKIIVFLIANLAFLFSFAEGSRVEEYSGPNKKMYINSDQITFYNNKIFVDVKGDWEQVDRIESDTNGFYITEVNTGLSFNWTCRRCGYSENSPFSNYCKNCGKRWNDPN